jgi:hypothetical protein
VIGSWGPCPAGPAVCPGDIWSVNGCGSDGVVDINDLLAVIGAWGACGEAPDAFPGGLNDCFNVYCAGLSGTEWQECLEKCFAAFCEARPAECD